MPSGCLFKMLKTNSDTKRENTGNNEVCIQCALLLLTQCFLFSLATKTSYHTQELF